LLKQDVPPSIGLGLDIGGIPEAVSPINMQPKSTEANVKQRTSLFELIPGLNLNLRPKAKQEKPAVAAKTVSAPAFPDVDSGFDLPSFFREKE